MSEQPDKPTSLIIATPPVLSKQPAPVSSPADLIVEAEWVRRYPARRRRTWFNWLAVLLKVGAAFGLTWLFYSLPAGALPTPLQTWKNPVIIFCLVCFIGKTLLDTFFYDHYQP
jgi:hypothetical protein